MEKINELLDTVLSEDGIKTDNKITLDSSAYYWVFIVFLLIAALMAFNFYLKGK